MIHIGLCADERFAMPLGVCVTSIFQSNKQNEIFIHVLTQGLSVETERKLYQIASTYNQRLQIYMVNESLFNEYPLSSHFPHSIYFRYLLPQILSEDITKVLYMDCDTVVLEDLCELWNTDITDNPIAAVRDANSDDIIERNRIKIFDDSYLNSGVLLMNLQMWRNEDGFKQLATFILNNSEKCVWPDQDALNVVFHNRIKWLSFRYNFQVILSEDYNRYRLHCQYHEDVKESFAKIVILHYSSVMQKPWLSDVLHPLAFIWRSIYQDSLWNNVKLKPRYGFVKRYIKTKMHMEPYRVCPEINREFMDQFMVWKNTFELSL